MNKLFKSVSAITLGLALAAGVGVGVSSKIEEVRAASTTVTKDNFAAISGDIITGCVSYAAEKGDGTTAPTISSGWLRIYKPASGKTLGSFVEISSVTSGAIKQVSFTNSNDYATAYSFQIDSEDPSSSTSIAKSETASTSDDISATKVRIYNTGTNRLSIASITVTVEGEIEEKYKVTYSGNGSTSGTAPVDDNFYNSGDEVTVLANTDLEKTGYSFDGWNTQADGKGTDYVPGSQFNITENASLFAQWTPNAATISFNANGGTGVAPEVISSHTGEKVTLPAADGISCEGFAFSGWNTQADGQGKTYAVGAEYSVTGNAVFYAKWSTCIPGTFTLVKDVNNLKDGDKVIIASANTDFALGPQDKTNRKGASIFKSEDKCQAVSEVQVIELDIVDGKYVFLVENGDLYASSSSSNNLQTESTNTANGQWSIEINGETGVASIVAQGSNTRKYMQHNPNNGSPIFSCYASASQRPLSIYKLDGEKQYLVDDFASDLLNQTNSICADGGLTDHSQELTTVFETLSGSSYWGKLSSEEQAKFTAADSKGTGVLAEAAARYDFVVAKYDLTNFASREPIVLTTSNVIPHDNVASSNTSIIIIVVVAVASVTGLGILLVLKRRKGLVK